MEPQAWFSFVRELRRLLASLPDDGARAAVLAELPEDVQTKLASEWRYFARPQQLEAAQPPDGKSVVLANAGRGAGKTWLAAHWVTEKVRYGGYGTVALVGETAADARDIHGRGGERDPGPEPRPTSARSTSPPSAG